MSMRENKPPEKIIKFYLFRISGVFMLVLNEYSRFPFLLMASLKINHEEEASDI